MSNDIRNKVKQKNIQNQKVVENSSESLPESWRRNAPSASVVEDIIEEPIVTSPIDDKVEPKGDVKPENTPEYQKYYDMHDSYMKEYLGRDKFEYDVNADEIYKIYRDQAIEQAERTRRDTTAQAAGLTGGYGSSYAAAMGAAAANDVIAGVDDMIPELYEAALGRYNAKGEELLRKAEAAAAYGDELYMKSPEYLSALLSASDSDNFEIEQALKTTKGIYDYDGSNNTGATWYDEGMRIYAGINPGNLHEKYLGEHKDYNESQIRNDLITWVSDDGKYMTREQIDYLVEAIMNEREMQYLSAMTDSNGVSLATFVNTLINSKVGFDEAYEKLAAWQDVSGEKLSEEEIYLLLGGI